MEDHILEKSIAVKDIDNNKRVDVFLFEQGFFPSRNSAARAIADEQVFLDSKAISKNYRVKSGDVLKIKSEGSADNCELAPVKIDLNKLYEDGHILIISKQPGLMTHPANSNQTNSVMNALIYDYGVDGLCKCQGNEKRPGIVHRLDAYTSGVMVCAKTDLAGKLMIDMISNKEVDRRYLTLVHGTFDVQSAKIVAPLRRHATHRTKMVVGEGVDSKEAITDFSVLINYSSKNNIDFGYSLCECKLQTGRTHQIRAHMQHIKHPVVGDPLYSAFAPKTKASSLGLTRQFLHSYYINFKHPITGEAIEIYDPITEDLQKSLLQIRDRVANVSETYESRKSSIDKCLGF